ncbi:Selenocysteine-specific translation elongation factor [Thioalkalivibrio nitratireducens DSM 14787]|uniref:Selenocysteine-specific elongation factor n=1 Tax=Thioalkalivibrio nitratireducens (strain DSM 14787 / UNIQEM 213 / ALEN2) TaxID=1255043 RepID=L0DW92_THIND|nr:selenocysteine-specific translation elongation factor [Thioalkalivibrio nitratireducens]AGA32626.1 Selenocysteine-specific translation elongation factor [Thioalkalivibrio nitratireducens DSM 14787]
MIVGTAGHIDHGKTALVKALTGVEADRLAEEQARGITLDLGYAYQPLASGEVLGFVDVPGHEKLVHNMLAGATGIDFVLLVIAADDGPMPQTREHLQILELLGLNRGAVALTKTDLADEARLDALQGEIQALLAPTGLAGAPVFPVSALTGTGVDALRTHLHAKAAAIPPRPAAGRFRLAIDRRFTLSGSGTVVTGTAHAGRVRVGDEFVLSPSGQPVRVRGIHAQNRPAETGAAGQRCALNLTGPGLEKDAIARGDWVLHPELHRPTARIDARVRALADAPKALRHWSPVHLHLGSARLMARVAVLEGDAVEPGSEGFAQLVLEGQTHALRGDRFVLRDPSARHNLAGGVVLDDRPPARGRRRPARIALLRALALDDPAEALAAMLPHAERGLNLRDFARMWNLEDAWAAAQAAGTGLRAVETPAGPVAFAPEHWDAHRLRTLAMLAEEHQRHPDRLGPDRERLRRLAAPLLERPVFGTLLDEMTAAGEVVLNAPWIHLPGHRVMLAPTDERIWLEDIRPLLGVTPFNPPRVRDIARALRLEEDRVRRLMRQLAGMGEVYKVAHDHYYTRAAVADLAAIARELSELEGKALAAPFRDRIGTGRKVAIQILEFFDRIGYSRRVGDEHRIFPDSLLRLR